MAVFVVSCGRSGTNLILETLAGNSNLRPSDIIENKLLFKRPKKYGKRYLTKCDTYYISNTNQIVQLMRENPDAKIIWTIRDPRDMCMSKIYRGWKKKAEDASIEGCLKDLSHMFDVYTYFTMFFSDRILVVKMEDLIRNIERESKKMCEFIGIEYEENMNYPYKRMRETKKKYTTLDRSQIELWKRYRTVYDGFFSDWDLPNLFNEVKYLIEVFGYDKT